MSSSISKTAAHYNVPAKTPMRKWRCSGPSNMHIRLLIPLDDDEDENNIFSIKIPPQAFFSFVVNGDGVRFDETTMMCILGGSNFEKGGRVIYT